MTSGDVFVLHPKDRPDECLELTGEELILIHRMLNVDFDSWLKIDELYDKFDKYFEGLK